jgi:hypothetical protein
MGNLKRKALEAELARLQKKISAAEETEIIGADGRNLKRRLFADAEQAAFCFNA